MAARRMAIICLLVCLCLCWLPGNAGALSTADAMAYPVYDLPQFSWDVPGWLEACIRFFREVGLTITDREVHI